MSRTTVGRDFVAEACLRSPQPPPANVLALSESTRPVPAQGSNTDTVLAGAVGNELTTEGLARGVATFAHTAGTQTATLQRTFTHSGPAGGGTPRTPRIVGVFSPDVANTPGAADTGRMVYETPIPNPPTLTGTDSLNQQVVVDYGA